MLSVEYDFGVPTLAELIGPTLQKKVRENSEMMLAGLKREAEAKRSAVDFREGDEFVSVAVAGPELGAVESEAASGEGQ